MASDRKRLIRSSFKDDDDDSQDDESDDERRDRGPADLEAAHRFTPQSMINNDEHMVTARDINLLEPLPSGCKSSARSKYDSSSCGRGSTARKFKGAEDSDSESDVDNAMDFAAVGGVGDGLKAKRSSSKVDIETSVEKKDSSIETPMALI